MGELIIPLDIYSIIYELEQKLYYKNEKLRCFKHRKEIKKVAKSINKLEYKLAFYYNCLNSFSQIKM